MIYCGIDLHRKYSYMTVMGQDGTIIKQAKIETKEKETKDFFGSFQEKPLCVIEPVSQWYWYADVLESAGCAVKIAHPKNVRAIASARIKTDKIDSEVLAHLLRSNLLPEAYLSPPEIRDFKELVRARASLVHLRTQAKNKVHAVLHKNGLTHAYTDLFGARGRTWLDTLKLNEAFRASLESYLSVVDKLESEIGRCQKRISAAAKESKEVQLLTSIKGISYYSALTIVSEIGDIDRFPDARHLFSYAGIVPSVYSSGGKTRKGAITKQGSKWLRWTIIETAQRQSGYKDTYFSNYYRTQQVKKGSNTAAVATARKMLAVIYRMLKDGTPFDERRLVSEGDTHHVIIAR